MDEKKEMPVYVKIEDYKDILDIINLTREKVDQIKSLLEKIQKLKEKEDSGLANWMAEIEEIESRISVVDSALLAPQR